MQNIFLDNTNLNDVILKLETDNNDIDLIIKKIHEELKKLDESIWKSSEKEKLDKKYNDYFQKIEYGLVPYLKECSNFLKKSSEYYDSTNNKLLDNAELLDDGNIGDV